MTLLAHLPRALAVALLAACTTPGPAPRFAPAAPAMPVVTYPAVRAYARDVQALRDAGGVVLGELTVDAATAARAAARRGATHYVWVGDAEEARPVASLCWSRPALMVAPVATTCRPSTERVTSPHFVLVRVEPNAWPALPAPLRPAVELTPLPASCRCSENVGGREIWCAGRLWRATPLELEIYCAEP